MNEKLKKKNRLPDQQYLIELNNYIQNVLLLYYLRDFQRNSQKQYLQRIWDSEKVNGICVLNFINILDSYRYWYCTLDIVTWTCIFSSQIKISLSTHSVAGRITNDECHFGNYVTYLSVSFGLTTNSDSVCYWKIQVVWVVCVIRICKSLVHDNTYTS